MPTALITGTSQGLGRALAERLLADGWTVHGFARGKQTITHAHFHGQAVDVTDEAAALDSIGLVTLIADLEEDIRVATGKTVTLADEKAMSRLTSPFRRVDLLAEYVVEIVGR